MRKKEWGKPKLISLVRLKGETVILANCKYGAGGGPGGDDSGCHYYTYDMYSYDYSCTPYGFDYNYGDCSYINYNVWTTTGFFYFYQQCTGYQSGDNCTSFAYLSNEDVCAGGCDTMGS